jgi:hypothetical protein
MRRLTVREWGLSKGLTRLVVPKFAGTPPALRFHLRELNWWLDETTISYLQYFLSPHLTKIVITTDTFVGGGARVEPWDELPDEVLPLARSAIRMFPSSLQSLSIHLDDELETHLTEEISAYVIGCGESLQELHTNLVLSTQAIVHLMKLPNLCIWATRQGPPQVTDLIRHGVPDGVTSFPSLEVLDMRSEAGLEWLPLLEATKNRTSPWIIAGGNLPALTYHHLTLPLDSSLVSRFLPFADLVNLNLKTGAGCFMRPCVSRFMDQDVEHLAIALPKLEVLTLGWPCSEDTCPTIVRSLLFLFIHCTKLKHLSIHFRMASLQADMVDTLGYAYSQGLHSRPKCALEVLVTEEMPLRSTDNAVVVQAGLLMIFPSLTNLAARSPTWAQLEVIVKALGPQKELPAAMEKLMRYIKEARELAENGVPARSAVSSRLSFGWVGGCGFVCLLTLLSVRLCRTK